jgi:hypothetical protein
VGFSQQQLDRAKSRKEAISMYRIAISMPGIREKREVRPRRRDFNDERAVEIYFAVMTALILGMIVGIGAYAVHSVIPAWQKYQSQEWQRSHFPRNLTYPRSVEFESHLPDFH